MAGNRVGYTDFRIKKWMGQTFFSQQVEAVQASERHSSGHYYSLLEDWPVHNWKPK
ncbi:GLE1 RNA export mediator-like (yeast), isoform CRA_a [Rattus norvegicus]|uniref:GLE1 RNA export mediator-like (Yeast), isoform CRA_a n=1 Tax=Rattus norvegicus TaxID=10116 RepID=A6JTU0_RAT|nr:GLE1 RNA export mediator-like (yeast), isoform CRA_a [Rattus norvegicus]